MPRERYEHPDGRTTVKTPQGECWFECSTHGGRQFTGIDAIEWAKEADERGAGDILLTSMDRDGTKDGFDIPLTKAVADAVRIPVIASGGVGKPEHMLEVFRETKAQAALAASIFHYNEYPISEVKKYLKEERSTCPHLIHLYPCYTYT